MKFTIRRSYDKGFEVWFVRIDHAPEADDARRCEVAIDGLTIQTSRLPVDSLLSITACECLYAMQRKRGLSKAEPTPAQWSAMSDVIRAADAASAFGVGVGFEVWRDFPDA